MYGKETEVNETWEREGIVGCAIWASRKKKDDD